MLSKKLFISLFITFITVLLFSNYSYATYNIDKEKVNQILDKGYFISGAYKSEQLCIDKIAEYNRIVGYYNRSECFRSNDSYYYLKCEKSMRCDLNYILNNLITYNGDNYNQNNYSKTNPTNNISNTSFNGTVSNNNNSFSKVYLFRTFNNKTGKYYLKYSTTKSLGNIITHDGEYIDGTSVFSNEHINGTRAIYLGGDGVDGYITYNTTRTLLGYARESAGNGRIAIYNCFKGDDYFISYDKSCNLYTRYNDSVFYMYPDDVNNNINNKVVSSSYLTLGNNLTIIAHTNIDKDNISFCVLGKNKCVKLDEKWEDYYVPGTNKREGYIVTLKGVPTGNYEGYFKYITDDGRVKKSNNFKQIINDSLSGDIVTIGKHKVKVTFSIPELFSPKFYINYNGGEYNLIDEGWNITRSNGLINYTQNLSLFIKGIYNSYVTYGNNKINLNSVSIK